jgi:hypothetical protein
LKVLGFDLRILVSRTTFAVFYGFATLLVFYEIPNLLLKNVATGSVGNLPIENEGYFLTYAILITVLSGLQIIFKGHFLGDAASVSNGVAQIFYIYSFANGGFFTEYLSSVGVTVSINFQTILYLMMIPSALTIISTVISTSARISMRRSELVLDEVTL